MYIVWTEVPQHHSSPQFSFYWAALLTEVDIALSASFFSKYKLVCENLCSKTQKSSADNPMRAKLGLKATINRDNPSCSMATRIPPTQSSNVTMQALGI